MKLEKPYFLSARNPLANTDQRTAEAMAADIASSPAGKQARERAAFLWRRAMGHDGATDQAWTLFEAAMEEYAFNYTLKAVGSDGNYPCVVRNFLPAHQWLGMNVPGARLGGDNPDNCYRHVGISHGARYELEGHVVGCPPAHVSFTLVSNFATSDTVCSLDSRDVVFESDGSFRVTIDDQPADGRPNHLTTTPAVKLLFIRDSMEDWAKETPYAYRVRRLDPPTADPVSKERIAEIAARIMTEDVPISYWFTRLSTGLPRNTHVPATASGATGGLLTQAGSLGHYRLQDDDAVVITIERAGAAYLSYVAYDWWFRSIEYWRRTSSLTSATMTPDPGGTRTLVLSLQDPGLHNWIDPVGLQDLMVFCRWQGLPRQQLRDGPSIAARPVKFRDLANFIPSGTATFTAAEREQQRAARQAAYQRRLIED